MPVRGSYTPVPLPVSDQNFSPQRLFVIVGRERCVSVQPTAQEPVRQRPVREHTDLVLETEGQQLA